MFHLYVLCDLSGMLLSLLLLLLLLLSLLLLLLLLLLLCACVFAGRICAWSVLAEPVNALNCVCL